LSVAANGGQRIFRDPPTEISSESRPLPKGDTDENPHDIGFFALLVEDFRTYERNPLDLGFWTVAIHRFGNWRMRHPKMVRAPLTIAYHALFRSVRLVSDIDLPYNTKLGRRVRIWYRGGIHLGARSIGNDVHIRHNTTCGVLHRHHPTRKPIIEDGVDIGPGVCILGDVTVGAGSVIGANSVVVRSVPPQTTVFGVPARPVALAPEK
jgi:serine O-acetyltransferase